MDGELQTLPKLGRNEQVGWGEGAGRELGGVSPPQTFPAVLCLWLQLWQRRGSRQQQPCSVGAMAADSLLWREMSPPFLLLLKTSVEMAVQHMMAAQKGDILPPGSKPLEAAPTACTASTWAHGTG